MGIHVYFNTHNSIITVPASIVIVSVLGHLGGSAPVWEEVASRGQELLSVTRSDVPAAFGITLALGLLTATLAGQSFWQVVWGLKQKEVGRAFLWAGAWFLSDSYLSRNSWFGWNCAQR